jgi:hypothetical protein
MAILRILASALFSLNVLAFANKTSRQLMLLQICQSRMQIEQAFSYS